MPSKSNNTVNVGGNNECNSTTVESHLISSSNLASSFSTPPPSAAQLLKEERSRYLSTSLTTTSPLSSISTLPSEFNCALPGVVSNQPTSLPSLKCETSLRSRTNTPSTCLLSPNSTVLNIKHNGGNDLKDLELKASLYNSTSNSASLGVTSINSLAAKYFDIELKPTVSTSSGNFFKKSLKHHDKIDGLSALKDASLINVDLMKLEVEAALVNSNNNCLNTDLKQLATAAKVAKFEDINSDKGSSFRFSGLVNSNANIAETTIESVKTMECDSSVPSPPKINDQHLIISVSGSSNLTDKTEISLLIFNL